MKLKFIVWASAPILWFATVGYLGAQNSTGKVPICSGKPGPCEVCTSRGIEKLANCIGGEKWSFPTNGCISDGYKCISCTIDGKPVPCPPSTPSTLRIIPQDNILEDRLKALESEVKALKDSNNYFGKALLAQDGVNKTILAKFINQDQMNNLVQEQFKLVKEYFKPKK